MYNYQDEKQSIFTESGQITFLAIRDHVHKCLEVSGAVTLGRAISAGTTGDSWQMMACVDRLVELGEIKEIQQQGYVPGQHKVYVKVGEQ